MLEIPKLVSDDEPLMRTIFSPFHVNHKGKLRSSFMRPPLKKPDEDDESIVSNKLSVTRYKYANIELCRKHAKSHSSDSRSYWGFALFMTKDLRYYGCDVLFKPVADNLAHANIVYPYKIPLQKAGEQISPEYSYLIKKLTESAKVIKDPNPSSEKWEGEQI